MSINNLCEPEFLQGKGSEMGKILRVTGTLYGLTKIVVILLEQVSRNTGVQSDRVKNPRSSGSRVPQTDTHPISVTHFSITVFLDPHPIILGLFAISCSVEYKFIQLISLLKDNESHSQSFTRTLSRVLHKGDRSTLKHQKLVIER